MIHAIKLEYDAEATYLTETYIPQWLTTHTAWDDPRCSNDPPVVTSTTDGSGVEYASGGVWRFAWSASTSVLLDNLWSYVTSYADWARLQYHECDHDEEGDGSCEWREEHTRTHGTIPDEVRL